VHNLPEAPLTQLLAFLMASICPSFPPDGFVLGSVRGVFLFFNRLVASVLKKNSSFLPKCDDGALPSPPRGHQEPALASLSSATPALPDGWPKA